jgi:hypothetical protein
MKTSYHDAILYGTALIIGQSLCALSSFFWDSTGTYTVNGSTILILGMLFWTVGFSGLFGYIKDLLPAYSRLGLIYACYGCLGGIAFGFEGLYSAILVRDKLGVMAFNEFPTQMNLVLFWAGPAFPLSLLCYGITIVWKKIFSMASGILMIVGAAGFPVSRILRIEMIAHVVDLLLLCAVVFISRELASKAATAAIAKP